MADTNQMNVPLCDLQAQYMTIKPELEAAALRVLASGQAILGPEVTKFEESVAKFCGSNYGVSCNSGSDALLLALCAADIGPGDEVIIPPFTFFATAGAICRTGAKPVFTDIDYATFNIDPMQIENKITPRTKAIMPVHLFGQCADMEPIWRIAERHNLLVIEDSAQSLGAEYQGKKNWKFGCFGVHEFLSDKKSGRFW